MRLPQFQGLQESRNIVREKLRGVGALGVVCFTRPSQVDGDAGKVLGVLCHLKSVAGVIGGQVGNQDEGLARPFLIVVHRDVVNFDLGDGSLSFRTRLSYLRNSANTTRFPAICATRRITLDNGLYL